MFLLLPSIQPEADLVNNQLSIDRALDKHLYLTTENKLDDGHPTEQPSHWLFPQLLHRFGQERSLRETADRLVGQLFPSLTQSQYRTLGNAPCGLHQYLYPKSVAASGKLGSRTFFFKLFIDPQALPSIEPFGNRLLEPVLGSEKGEDNAFRQTSYAWLTYDELAQRMGESAPRFWRTTQRMIYPDELIDLEQMLKSNKKVARLTRRLMGQQDEVGGVAKKEKSSLKQTN